MVEVNKQKDLTHVTQGPGQGKLIVLERRALRSALWHWLGLRLGLRMDFLLCPILRPNILIHIFVQIGTL